MMTSIDYTEDGESRSLVQKAGAGRGSRPRRRRKKIPSIMKISFNYYKERMLLEVPYGLTVAEVKKLIREKFRIGSDDGRPDKKILTLNYGGADLGDSWVFSDVGVQQGSTVKVLMREEIKPVLYVYCLYSQDNVKIVDQIQVSLLSVAELRGIASRKTGMPVGAFRLVTVMGREMYDGHLLDEYGVEVGHTVRLETWDGWNDFLNLAINGFTSHVMARLSTEDLTALYQMRVAMYIAAHYGHVDLCVTLQRQGVRPDEPVGNHPYRQWCHSSSHVDALKTAVHEAAEVGQLGILRTFAHSNICVITAKDGLGRKPLNVAIQAKQEQCVKFLLSKQYSRVVYAQSKTIPASIYVSMKNWSDRAKKKVLFLYGWEKSSFKRRPYCYGALVGQGIHIDGFTKSAVTGNPAPPPQKQSKALPALQIDEGNRENFDYESYFRQQAKLQFKLPRLTKWDRMSRQTSNQASELPEISNSSKFNRKKSLPRKRSDSETTTDMLRLPPIREGKMLGSRSLQNLPSTTQRDTEYADSEASDELLDSFDSENVESKDGKADRGVFVTAYKAMETYNELQSEHDIAKSDLKKKITNQKKKKQERALRSAVLLAKAKSVEGSLPLPLFSVETCPKPHFYGRNKSDGALVPRTLATYEKYRGQKARDYAITCLSLANNFKEKPWLQQVRLAMNFTAQKVKRTSKLRTGVFP
ncbi:uncharacterized protein LOC106181762 [Lingula anatina]|uniref:Uncharacterized protein LOC106181762 n=1 Tax=Lingula anatina TaxID=7574 RepID=A0A1S3KGC7_LINAN|nr:uncharacterized protein LOC106181762 [Lingula anatina]|eukprot:XP_013421695.1 uncharacterized protein LOC106181762 [Lingula anatina]